MASKFQKFSEKSKLYFEFYNEIRDVQKEWEKDREVLLTTLEEELKACFSKPWIVKKTGSYVQMNKEEWYSKDDRGIAFYLEPIKSEAAIELRVNGKPYDFNKDYVEHFQKFLNDDSGKKRIEEYRKSLTGGSLSLKKTVPLVQEDPVPMIITRVNEMIDDFESIIDKSTAEFKKATKSA